MLNDMDLDQTHINLDSLQQQEQEETDDLEALVRSQLYENVRSDEASWEKRLRRESKKSTNLK